MELRNKILNTIVEIKNKKENTVIPIETKELAFESSKYSSIKTNIWHVLINNIKMRKTSDYLIIYKCLQCETINTCATTQFLRKIREGKTQCHQCVLMDINSTCKSKEQHKKIEKIQIEPKKSLLQIYEESQNEFERYPDQYKNSYLLSHLTCQDYDRIKPKIISFGNGSYLDIDNYDFWSIYKVNNQMRFSSVLYDKKNDCIFKANQPILTCDNCHRDWRCKSIEQFKNCYKILCQECKLCNRTFKIRPTKNINNEMLVYQSKLELKFIEWCASNNFAVLNGPYIEYNFNQKSRIYRVDFQISDILIEIKDFHIWHKNQVASGQWEAKENAVKKYINDNRLNKFYFITPNNWNQMLYELSVLLKKVPTLQTEKT
jgi:hypothetical protein